MRRIVCRSTIIKLILDPGLKMRCVALWLLALSATAGVAQAGNYCVWEVRDFAIEAPLCGLSGDPGRGRAIAADSHGGNCLACHRMPIPEEDFHGTIGPPLDGIGTRYTPAQIRLRIVDEQQVNPMTIMPGFYRDPSKANRVADAYWGKTFLSAQQIEDLVAYLVTLK